MTCLIADRGLVVLGLIVLAVASILTGYLDGQGVPDASAEVTIEIERIALPPDIELIVDVAAAGGRVFSIGAGHGGAELFVYEAVGDGGCRVIDINPHGSSFPDWLTAVDNTLYFVADDGIHGRELWKSDGTVQGTHMVRDLVPGVRGSNISQLHGVGALLFFNTDDEISGEELWKSEGTEETTVLVRDLNPGSAGSVPGSRTHVGEKLYFSAFDDRHGRELWVSDGTKWGTILVRNLNREFSSDPSWLTEFQGKLVFCAHEKETGNELWITDGTESGTSLVRDIYPGESDSNPMHLFTTDGVFYFSADDGLDRGGMWVSDGTRAGTHLVLGTASGREALGPSGFNLANDVVTFCAFQRETGRELWKTDGTDVGTVLVKDIYPGTNSGVSGGDDRETHREWGCVVAGGILFPAISGMSSGTGLWFSDGTEEGTHLIQEFSPSHIQEFDPPHGSSEIDTDYPERRRAHAKLNGTVYFIGYDSGYRYGLWKLRVSHSQ